MSSVNRRKDYIPSTTTFIFGKNTRIENGNSTSPNKHWKLVREKVNSGRNGFKVPDVRNYGEGKRSNNHGSRNQARVASEDPIVATQQAEHWAYDRVFDFTKEEGEEEGSSWSPNYARSTNTVNNNVPKIDAVQKSEDRPRSISVYDPNDVRRRAEGMENRPNEKTAKNRRSRSLNDRSGNNKFEDDQANRYYAADRPNLSNEQERQKTRPIPSEKRRATSMNVPESRHKPNSNVTDQQYRTEKDGSFDTNTNRQPSSSQVNSLPIEERSNVSDSFLSQSEMSSKRDEESDASSQQTDISSDDERSDDTKKSLVKDKSCFLKRCAPKFAAKILNAIEKSKNECKLCLDEVTAKYKNSHMAKGQPVFTSYSCENSNGENESFRQSMKKRISSLAAGFYSKACTEMKMIADFLFDEESPEEDGTWDAIEGEFGTRCVPKTENTIVEDNTVYVCSCCFDGIFDRNVYVGTMFLDQVYGCCGPVFISRSFENRPPFCEARLASMSEKKRNLLLKIIGKEFQMKGGVRCNAQLPDFEDENEEKLQNESIESSQ